MSHVFDRIVASTNSTAFVVGRVVPRLTSLVMSHAPMLASHNPMRCTMPNTYSTPHV
jgi:hypothetical protein